MFELTIGSLTIISGIEANDSPFSDLPVDKDSSHHDDSPFLVSDNTLILNEYSKLDIDNMMKLVHDRIIATCSRKEKEKYRQAALDEITRRKNVLYAKDLPLND